jgi:hypothetical protein
LDDSIFLQIVIALALAIFFVLTAAYVLWLWLGPIISVPVGLIGFYTVAKMTKKAYDENK